MSEITLNKLSDEDLALVADLTDLDKSLDTHQDFGAILKMIASRVSSLLEVGRCSIMLLRRQESGEHKMRVFAYAGDLPAEALSAQSDISEGIAGKVAISGKPLLVSDINQSECRDMARHAGKDNQGFISCPLKLAGTVIGVVNISHPIDDRVLGKDDLRKLILAAMFISQEVQINQLKLLLKSNFVTLAIARETESDSISVVNDLMKNNDRIVKILAKSFYQEMQRAGCSTEQIISSATEIISLVTECMDTRP